jgi:PadR family transcriptional regulator PadR
MEGQRLQGKVKKFLTIPRTARYSIPRRTRYDLDGRFPGKGWKAMKLDKGLVAGSSTLLVLSLLEHGDLYGYQMIEELARRSNDVFQMKEGTLYPILHALEKGKYLSSYEQQAPTGRMRKYYKLTRKGRELLADKKTEWARFHQGVEDVLSGGANALGMA